MIGLIKYRQRGATPRGMARTMNAHKKHSWEATGKHFHLQMRDDRFTPSHARAAGYTRRSPKYEARKRKTPFGGGVGQANPLEYSGATRRAVRAARITASSKHVRVAYAGARALNFRNPKSRVNAAAEFRKVLPREARELAVAFDKSLDQRLASDNSSSTDQL